MRRSFFIAAVGLVLADALGAARPAPALNPVGAGGIPAVRPGPRAYPRPRVLPSFTGGPALPAGIDPFTFVALRFPGALSNPANNPFPFVQPAPVFYPPYPPPLWGPPVGFAPNPWIGPIGFPPGILAYNRFPAYPPPLGAYPVHGWPRSPWGGWNGPLAAPGFGAPFATLPVGLSDGLVFPSAGLGVPRGPVPGPFFGFQR